MRSVDRNDVKAVEWKTRARIAEDRCRELVTSHAVELNAVTEENQRLWAAMREADRTDDLRAIRELVNPEALAAKASRSTRKKKAA